MLFTGTAGALARNVRRAQQFLDLMVLVAEDAGEGT